MKLSKSAAHAVLAVTYLARQTPGMVVQAKQVADHLEVPVDSALKVLQSLSRHRLIDSQLGRGGGYRLLLKPRQLTLLQIIEALDGPILAHVPASMPSRGHDACSVLEAICEGAAEKTRRHFSNATVADLLVCGPVSLAHAG